MMEKLKSLMRHFIFSTQISIKASVGLFCCRIIVELLMVISPIISSYLTKLIIDFLEKSIMENTKQYRPFFTLVVLMVLLQILSMLLNKINSFINNNHTELISHQIQLQILHKVNDLDISYYDNPKFHNEIQNANRDSQAMLSLSRLLIAIIRGGVSLFTCGIIMGRLNLVIPLVILILNVPSAFIDKYISKTKYVWERSKTTNERKIDYIKWVLNSRQYAKDVRVFHVKDYFFNRFEELWKNWYIEKQKIEYTKVTYSFLASVLPYIATMVVFIYVGLLIISKKLLRTGIPTTGKSKEQNIL